MLRLSGLALAGANRAGSKSGDDDGILTAQEIVTMDLSSLQWAILSACDTGSGEIQVWEGVLGLRRAFQASGARTIIMSLWAVEDESAHSWMTKLYHALFIEHLDIVEAVHEASLGVLHDRRARGLSTDPSHWATFVASGDDS